MKKATLNEKCTMKNVKPAEISAFFIRLRFSAA